MKLALSCALAAVLVLPAAPSWAAWTEIERFDDGIRVFVDRDSARRDGDRAEVRHLVRWAELQADPGQPPFASTVVRTAYDCVNKWERFLSSASYAGTMGDGPRVAVDLNEAEGWSSVSAGSMEEKLWQTACGLP